LALTALISIPRKDEPVVTTSDNAAYAPALPPLSNDYQGELLKFKLESATKNPRLASWTECENILRGMLGDEQYLQLKESLSNIYQYSFSNELSKSNSEVVVSPPLAAAAIDSLSAVSEKIGNDSSKKILKLLKAEGIAPQFFGQGR
jgi:hypothetical protein